MTFKVKDHYFKKAKEENYFARSVYKLKEIDEKYHIFQKNQFVLDLGYHPGSWSQYALEKIGSKGKVVGVDIKEVNTKFEESANIWLMQKDIYDIHSFSDLGVDHPFDIIMSDMAPNTTGMAGGVDQLRSLALVEHAFHLTDVLLKKNDHFITKVFDSQDAQAYLKTIKNKFKEVRFLKPNSTRTISREFFVICKNFI